MHLSYQIAFSDSNAQSRFSATGHQKPPGELDHAAADPGVAGSCEPYSRPLRAVLIREPVGRRTGTCRSIRLILCRGTKSLNPSPSSGESRELLYRITRCAEQRCRPRWDRRFESAFLRRCVANASVAQWEQTGSSRRGRHSEGRSSGSLRRGRAGLKDPFPAPAQKPVFSECGSRKNDFHSHRKGARYPIP
jgi:hypothetical protein